MGLAEPRKRTKLAHDPRNLAWMNSTDSYGHRLMQQQGWKAGDALGAKGTKRPYADTEAAKVAVQYKDDNLGLGATLKSKDIANQRTGFDAFQGLLGRLNAKSDEEVKAVEKKLEDKKLAMFAQGRWGGMVFVPGGLLVQTDPFKQKLELEKASLEQKELDSNDAELAQDSETSSKDNTAPTTDDEKIRLKAEKRLRKEQKRQKKAQKNGEQSDAGLPTPDSSSSNEEQSTSKDRKRKATSPVTVKTVTRQSLPVKNGRHILRGKNISAKRAAFADMKGLDEIFMRRP